MRALAKLPKGWRTTPEFMRAAGYFCTNNSKTDYNCDIDGAKVWDVSSNTAHYRDSMHLEPNPKDELCRSR